MIVRHSLSVAGAKGTSGTNTPTIKKKGNSRKYICPHCGNIARTTKDMKLICGDCMKLMEIED
jgi:predicted RNA-binding Zn-ribbon protein involved in translation (DUF1610 family)